MPLIVSRILTLARPRPRMAHTTATCQVGMHEKAVYYQTQVSDELRREIVEIQREIDKEEAGREDALAQAKTGDKAELARALHRTLESLQQAISLLLSLDYYGVNRPCEDRTRKTRDESTVCVFVSGEARQGA